MTTFNTQAELQEAIRTQITTNDRQALKAMMRIYTYQTADEQEMGDVTTNNGVGFASTDAEILTSFCHQFETKGWLSPKQMTIVRKKMGKYAGQLMRQAIKKGLYVKKDGAWTVIK